MNQKEKRETVLVTIFVVFCFVSLIYLYATDTCDDTLQSQIECAENLRENLRSLGRPSFW